MSHQPGKSFTVQESQNTRNATMIISKDISQLGTCQKYKMHIKLAGNLFVSNNMNDKIGKTTLK
jgi:hypothetical protein